MADNVVLARNTDEAPQNDRFAQTVAFSHYNNISAQLPIDPVSNQIVVGGVAEQAAQCLRTSRLSSRASTSRFDDIVEGHRLPEEPLRHRCRERSRTRASSRFGHRPRRGLHAGPHRGRVAELPMHALVQIEAVVSHGDGTRRRKWRPVTA